MNSHLVIIDPQNDFCDPGRGALYVPGADRDMQTLADWIDDHGARLEQIHVTLDSHQTLHIAHPIFWKNSQGRHPAPFTTITRADVEGGKWTTANPQWRERGLAYVRALENHRRYELTIWPPHCRIGTWGHGIFPRLSDSLLGWEEKYLANIDFLLKGSNPFTEHYSAVVADVPDETDPSTKLNTRFMERLKSADRIYFSGEALSHCLANTVTDIANHFGQDNVTKFILLRNTASNVAGCEALGESFVDRLAQRGMRILTTQEAAV